MPLQLSARVMPRQKEGWPAVFVSPRQFETLQVPKWIFLLSIF